MIVLKCALPYSIVYVAAYMLVMIQVPIEKVMGIGGQALVTFIDYSKPFHSIRQVQLFDRMLELGFPEHVVALLQCLYIYQTAVIRRNESTTDIFPIGRGARQGCILSPHLFSLYTESVMRGEEIQDLGYNIGWQEYQKCTLCRRHSTHRTVTNGDAATTRQSQSRICAKASGTKCQKDKIHDYSR